MEERCTLGGQQGDICCIKGGVLHSGAMLDLAYGNTGPKLSVNFCLAFDEWVGFHSFLEK